MNTTVCCNSVAHLAKGKSSEADWEITPEDFIYCGRAKSVVAEKGDWGTIVIGRRGLSRVSEFFMGRVSNKVVHVGRMDAEPEPGAIAR